MRRYLGGIVFVVMFTFLFGCAAQKTRTAFVPTDLNPKLQSGQLEQKVENFLVINDVSESMLDTYKGKMKMKIGRSTIENMNQTIPNIKLDAALRLFGNIRGVHLSNTELVYGLTSYTKDGLSDAVKKTGRVGGFSPLDQAINGASDDLKSASKRIAVIVVSDGQDMEPAVAAASNMKSQYGDRLCIYTIQVGNHPKGKNLLERVAQAGGCGYNINAENIASSGSMADYVESVFFGKAAPVVVEQKQEAQAQAEPKIITMTLNVEFDTGKSNIRPQYSDEIKKVADFMKENPQVTAVIEGHTDTVGKRKMNLALSKARANSVRNYLIKKFNISSSRLGAVGYGPDKPIADNATVEGRQKNRRVQAVIDTNPKDTTVVKADEKKAKKKVLKKKKKRAKKAVKKNR